MGTPVTVMRLWCCQAASIFLRRVGVSAAKIRVSVSPGFGKKIWVVVVVITRLPRCANSLARVYIVVVLPPAPVIAISGLVGRSMRSHNSGIHVLYHFTV